MNNNYKAKKQLINELKKVCKYIKKLEKIKNEHDSIETSLKERENRYRTLLENLPQKIFLKDKNSVYISCNENFARDLNIEPKEIVGKTDYEFFSKKLADKYRKDDRRIMKSGKIEDIEEKYIQNGKEYWVHTVKTPVKNENGDVTGILGIFWDISNQKESEIALKRAEEKWTSLVENAPNFIMIVDREGLIHFINHGVEGIPISKAIRSKIYDYIDSEFHSIVRKTLNKVFKNGECGRYIVKGVGPSGPKFKSSWYETHVGPIKLEDNIVAATLISSDITERKKTMDALAVSEKNYREIFNGVKEAIIIHNSETGDIIDINRAACKMLKINREEIIHDGLQVLAKVNSKFSKKEALKRIKLAADGKPQVIEWYNIDSAMKSHWIEASVRKANIGGKECVLSVARDITEHKLMDEKIKRRLEMEKTLTKLSETLVKTKNLDVEIKRVLGILGELFNVDYVSFFQIKEDGNFWENTYEWSCKGTKPKKNKFSYIPSCNFYGWVKRLEQNKIVAVPNIKELPAKILKDIKKFKKQKISSFLFLPLFYEKKIFGALGLFNIKKTHTWQSADIEILKTAGEIITSSLVKERYHNELSKTLKELEYERHRFKELAKQTINSQENERLYLSSEIHDEFIQNLIATLYFIEKCKIPSQDKKMKEAKEKVINLIKTSIDSGRRLISEIEPIKEPEIGLIQAIKKNINFRITDKKINVNFVHPENPLKMEFETKINILRIIQEAIMNVQKHSKATRLDLEIKIKKNKLFIEIKDNGVGFNVKSISKVDDMHYGLLMMQERANLIDGSLTIKSKIGKGTHIKGVFPYR